MYRVDKRWLLAGRCQVSQAAVKWTTSSGGYTSAARFVIVARFVQSKRRTATPPRREKAAVAQDKGAVP